MHIFSNRSTFFVQKLINILIKDIMKESDEGEWKSG